MNMRSSTIKVVKRKDREASAQLSTSSAEISSRREIVRTVKNWMAESRYRRQEEAKVALQFMRGLEFRELSMATESNGMPKCSLVLIVAGLILFGLHGTIRAQAPASSGDSLTLDQAIELALRNNHAIKIAEFGVSRVEEDIAVAKT